MSLRRKITYVIMINTFAALCAAGIAFAEYGVYRFKQMRIGDLNALANILGTNSTAPLEFKDPSAARDILTALAAKPHILTAVIYDRAGAPFAAYHPGISEGRYVPPKVGPDASQFTSNRVLVFQTITFDGEKVGSVFLEEDAVEYRELLEGYLLFFGMIVAAVSLGAFVMAARLQRPISNPILELAWTAKMVTSSRDYSIRARKRSEDEVGVLIDGFNQMLEQIQTPRHGIAAGWRAIWNGAWMSARSCWSRKWPTGSAPRKRCTKAKEESACCSIRPRKRSLASIARGNSPSAIPQRCDCWAMTRPTPCWA